MEDLIKSLDKLKPFELVDKWVRINIKHQPAIYGFIYTIDPVSQTIVLLSIDRDFKIKTKVSLVMIHEIENIQLQDKSNLSDFDTEKIFSKKVQSNKSQIYKNKIGRVVGLLEKNRLPVKRELAEDNKSTILSILDTVRIRSPYGPDECESTNEIILDRIRQILTGLND